MESEENGGNMPEPSGQSQDEGGCKMTDHPQGVETEGQEMTNSWGPEPGKDQKSELVNPDDGLDHPQGVIIRRQVEFYFSDENLPTDSYILEKCGGRQNLPVSLNSICGFPKMRRFKPRKLVVAALRRSAFLDVSENGKTIKRKLPFLGKTVLDEKSKLDDKFTLNENVKPKSPKKPDSHARQTSKKTAKPDGFEKYWVDGPIRAEEYQEEMDLYHEDTNLNERMEIAIERFKLRRRFHPAYVQIFNQFLRYGGVKHGQRQFTGNLEKEAMDQYDLKDRILFNSTYHIDWDRNDPEKWALDFTAVAKAFLGSHYPYHFSTQDISHFHLTIQVMEKFYNYLLHHDVCLFRSQREDIVAAKEILKVAETDVPACGNLGDSFPSPFNRACSIITNGYYGYESDTFELEKAKVIFAIGLGAMADTKGFDVVRHEGLEGVKLASPTRNVGLEIKEIQMPSDSTISYYKKASQNVNGTKIPLTPLGVLHCISWHEPGPEAWDLPDGLSGDDLDITKGEADEYRFYLEPEYLEMFKVHMKIIAEVGLLNTETHFFDMLHIIYPTFYEGGLLNGLVINGLKDLKWLDETAEQAMVNKSFDD